MQEKEPIIVQCKLKIPLPWITDRHHSASYICKTQTDTLLSEFSISPCQPIKIFLSVLFSVKELVSLHDKHLTRPTLDDNVDEEHAIEIQTQEITQVYCN